MKFTLSWLKDHLETNASLDEISKTLTAVGLEVESITDASAALAPFIVAEIVEAVQHPNADKLRVCKVNDGKGIRQVVCGAPNARAGIKVVLATEGVKIPANGMVIKKSKIRDVESNGMLCSAAELGLGEDGGGIIELPLSAKVGESAAAALGANDPVIDIAITPNRADCLGVYGVARDLAATGIGTLQALPNSNIKRSFDSTIDVKLESPACPLFIGCMIRGVKNGPSPEWLQQRLKAIGLRPISTLVDITNYMTMTYARPLHVYDAKLIKGSITARYAKKGESFKALNDKDYTLEPDMLAIADDSGVLGLGGIIGGSSTGVSETTTDVFLEAAWFDPIAIARTGRALSIDSDARYRFERGIDPAFVKQGAELATAMILELCGGEASELVIAGAEPKWKREIEFNVGRVATLGGMNVERNRIIDILTKLGFTFHGDKVQPPSWRADIDGEADLVEEVIRIMGFDHIPSTPLPTVGLDSRLRGNDRIGKVRKALASSGLTEVTSWAFVSQAQAEQFGGGAEALQLLNPISTDLSTMRPSLLPHLLGAVQRNADRGFADLALFEIGNVFANATPEGQLRNVASVQSSQAAKRNPFKTERAVDAFDAKADLFHALDTAGLAPEKLMIDRTVPAWYHPSRSGRISLGGKITLGYFGEIHPLVLDSFGIKNAVVAFELMLDAVPTPKAKNKAKPALTLSNFQAVSRDYAFMGDERIESKDVIKAIESADKQLIQSVEIFDLYAGKGVEPGKKSVALSVTLQAADRTLTDQEIEAVSQKIIAGASSVGLTLRQA